MGCFNVTCAGSNISIGAGDKVKLFILCHEYLLVESITFPRDGKIISPPLIPFCLPLDGEYDDYGRIAKIERTDTVEALEKYFDIKIEDFVNRLTSGRTDGFLQEDSYSKNPSNMKNIEITKSLYCCFMLTDIYEHLSKFYSSTIYSTRDAKVFPLLGFTEKELTGSDYTTYAKMLYSHVKGEEYKTLIKNLEKTKYAWVHKDLPDLEIFDLYYLVRNGKSKIGNFFSSFKDLDTFVKKNYKISLQDIAVDKNILNTPSSELEIQKAKKKIEDWGDDLFTDFLFISRLKTVTFGIVGVGDECIYTKDQVINNLKEFYNLKQVMHALHSCNRHLLPMPHGEQGGNHEAELKLNSKIQSILKEKIKAYKKYIGK